MEAIGLHILIFAPFAAALAIWSLPASRGDLAYRIALAVGGMVCAIGLGLWWVTTGDADALIGETRLTWVTIADTAAGAGVTIRYHVGLDAISAVLVGLTALLVPLSIACGAVSIRERATEYYAWLMVLTGAMFGVFAARDVLLFYVFFEFTLVPLYFLIGIWGGPERRYAANKFFLFTFVGSVITFAGILYLAIRAADGGAIDFDLLRLSSVSLSTAEQSLLFLALFCGFAIKVPLFPLHTWLPLAHTEAPTAGSVLLAGVLLKLGTYGFLRFSLPMTPEGAVAWAPLMGGLAICGIIYGALISWVQRDVKKLVAYSSVSHLGFCMLGMFSMMSAGLTGSVLYMVNHGINTGALFLVVGMIYDRYHTRDMDKLGGLARQMPVMSFFLIIFVLASVGLPLTNGFISEFTVLFAAYQSKVLGPAFGAMGAVGILLGAIYMLYMTGKVLFGPLNEPHGGPDLHNGRLKPDLTRREIAILAPLAALVLILGVAPKVLTNPLEPVLEARVLARVAPHVAPAAPSGRRMAALLPGAAAPEAP
ncbi:MAG: NADH-quinone oxidoreductase subunit M [Phycisphaerales bacterium]|nr:NADH-quinone oxidoreductase subunit M [Phycisphaerales bacterium]